MSFFCLLTCCRLPVASAYYRIEKNNTAKCSSILFSHRFPSEIANNLKVGKHYGQQSFLGKSFMYINTALLSKESDVATSKSIEHAGELNILKKMVTKFESAQPWQTSHAIWTAGIFEHSNTCIKRSQISLSKQPKNILKFISKRNVSLSLGHIFITVDYRLKCKFKLSILQFWLREHRDTKSVAFVFWAVKCYCFSSPKIVLHLSEDDYKSSKHYVFSQIVHFTINC